jgi:hypothetical protein
LDGKLFNRYQVEKNDNGTVETGQLYAAKMDAGFYDCYDQPGSANIITIIKIRVLLSSIFIN